MAILLLRHARYVFSPEAFQLKGGPIPSEQGMRETETFAKKSSKKEFKVIYANGSTRSKVTARMIAQHNVHHPSIVTDRRFDPIRGDYSGRDIVNHLRRPGGRLHTGPLWLDGALPSLEPAAEFAARNAAFFMDRIADQQENDTDILVVAHWETVAIARALFRNMSVRRAVLSTEGKCAHSALYRFEI